MKKEETFLEDLSRGEVGALIWVGACLGAGFWAVTGALVFLQLLVRLVQTVV